jgi:glutaredoxin-dependent peroxiredoxin
MALEPGQAAPDFILYDSEKKQLRLSETRETNVLLLFFPLAFTSTCTKELCTVRDNLGWYNTVEARVLAISVDSHYVLAKYKAEQQLNFTLLSDFNKEASTAYGSIYELFSYNMKGVPKRSAFVIDKSGIIRYAEVLENAGEIPNFSAIREILGNLK